MLNPALSYCWFSPISNKSSLKVHTAQNPRRSSIEGFKFQNRFIRFHLRKPDETIFFCAATTLKESISTPHRPAHSRAWSRTWLRKKVETNMEHCILVAFLPVNSAAVNLIKVELILFHHVVWFCLRSGESWVPSNNSIRHGFLTFCLRGSAKIKKAKHAAICWTSS